MIVPALLALASVHAQIEDRVPLASPVDIAIQADKPGITVSPSLYGIFFEEINQAGEGGIYGELLKNRGFEAGTLGGEILGWAALTQGEGKIGLDPENPLNDARKRSLKIESTSTTRFGAVNEGFWGIPVQKGARYRLMIWTKGEGDLVATLEDKDARATAEGVIKGSAKSWHRSIVTLEAKSDVKEGRLVLSRKTPGTTWIGFTSLLPEKTWRGRRNGMRLDLAQHVERMKPAFVRFPGGCYVEGNAFANAFDWKTTVGNQEDRPGLARRFWGYPSSDGLGYHEYLQWCEDLGAAPLFVANVGISHSEVEPMNKMDRWIQDALDAIEYANGPTSSKWGALRAKNGHPKPFGLKYVEIGNENGASWSFGGPEAYAPRYKAMFDAIKKAYPKIVTIADNLVPHPMEVIDEHYYADPSFFWTNASRYDKYDRNGPRIYVGEYAVTQDCGKGNLKAALGEAAFMVGMERNSDVVTMSSYAPLFANTHNTQWNPDAIVFDAARSYGTPSYHVQALFANNRPERILPVSYSLPSEPYSVAGGIGFQTWKTEAEFKDLTVEVDGQPVGGSEGKGLDQWETGKGKWTVENGVVGQSELIEDTRIRLKGVDLTNAKRYVIHVKARKKAGQEGFIVMFQLQGENQFLQWNLGGWGNTVHAFQRATGGGPNKVTEGVRGSIETDRWYDIRIEADGPHIRGYLDGKLIEEIVDARPPLFVAGAGLDRKTGDVIVKLVNGAGTRRPVKLSIAGYKLGAQATVTVLTGPNGEAENTFEDPLAISPQALLLPLSGSEIEYIADPYSLTILRIPKG